ncbi:MAG: hypothetical protein P4L40_12695 [Terracidiphilus sp.]|nr:hypothetical protein [Terracidiphilus sp.]
MHAVRVCGVPPHHPGGHRGQALHRLQRALPHAQGVCVWEREREKGGV